MLPITIRRAGRKDVPRLVELWKCLISYHEKYLGRCEALFARKADCASIYRKFLMKQLRRRNAAVFVAECDGRIAGHIMVEVNKLPPIYVHDQEAHVDEFVVDGAYRGRGIGKMLLKESENWARAKKIPSMGLTVDVRNQRAFSLYKKFGFSEHRLKMGKIIR